MFDNATAHAQHYLELQSSKSFKPRMNQARPYVSLSLSRFLLPAPLANKRSKLKTRQGPQLLHIILPPVLSVLSTRHRIHMGASRYLPLSSPVCGWESKGGGGGRATGGMGSNRCARARARTGAPPTLLLFPVCPPDGPFSQAAEVVDERRKRRKEPTRH